MFGTLQPHMANFRTSYTIGRNAAVHSSALSSAPCRRSTSLAASPSTKNSTATTKEQGRQQNIANEMSGLGDVLGPIGLTYSGGVQPKVKTQESRSTVEGAGVALGPIGLSFGTEFGDALAPQGDQGQGQEEQASSIHSMSTAEWREKFEKNGTVDLWLEEEFNAGSRLVGGRDVHKGGMYGVRTGEGPSVSSAVKHKVKIYNHYADQVVDVEVPEDRYILWEAEDEGLQLPYACRMGCCTACAVRIKEGEMFQPEALGLSAELREQGYALMCVGFPLSDLVLETVPEDEAYELQFGESFRSLALDPSNPESIERDDFAISIANMDE